MTDDINKPHRDEPPLLELLAIVIRGGLLNLSLSWTAPEQHTIFLKDLTPTVAWCHSCEGDRKTSTRTWDQRWCAKHSEPSPGKRSTERPARAGYAPSWMFDLPGLEGVKEVVISQQVVDGTARPLYMYTGGARAI